MSSHYIFIDYENVQPKNLEVLAKHPVSVFVFVGANQARLPVELVTAMQSMGDKGAYIRISGNGSNALDFHIAYYIGQFIGQGLSGRFSIISKDTGFDPLIRHLQADNVLVNRFKDLNGIPELKIKNKLPTDEKIDAIVKKLNGQGQSRPRKEKTLANIINALFTKKLTDSELAELINRLKEKGFVEINDNRIVYNLPKTV